MKSRIARLPRALCLALAAALLSQATLASSCAKGQARDSKAPAASQPASAPLAAQEPEPLKEAEAVPMEPLVNPDSAPEPAGQPDSDPEPKADTVAMKPSAPKAPQQRPLAASTLGGHDRHLMLRPLDVKKPSDFELGPLSGPRDTARPGAAATIEALKAGLRSGALPLELFTPDAARIAGTLYGKDSLAGIREVRVAEPEAAPGASYSARFRVLAELGGAWAPGLVLMSEGEGGSYRIEHFELDTAALASSGERDTPWDPYASPFLR